MNKIQTRYFSAFFAICGFLVPESSLAQWIFQTKENAFEPEKSMHIALTAAAGGYALGMRCQNGERSIVFVTPEKSDDISVLNDASPKLMIKVDKRPIEQYDAYLETLDGNVSAVVEDGSGLKPVFDQAREARTRVSIAIKILGQTMHATNFNVRGSTRSIQQLQKNCEIN